MSQYSTPIDVPGMVLAQQHGLFESGYHLIHPGNGDMSVGDDNEDELLIWPSPSEHPWWNPAQGMVERTAQSLPITNDAGNEIGRRIRAGVSWWAECCSDLGCHFECQPGYDCSEDVEPEDLKPVNENGSEQCYVPSYLTSRIQCSTFGHQAVDYWGMAERNLRGGREKAIENRLAEGDCVLDEEGNPANPNFSSWNPVAEEDVISGAVTPGPNDVVVLGGGDPQPTGMGLKLLNCALAECGCGAAGMIHAPVPVVDCWSCGDCINHSIVDYGDGMGWRNILRTKVRGNIIVAGAGYTGLGPGGEEPGPNQAWIYSTSMVYLMWDKIEFTPKPNDYKGVNLPINLVDVVAEQVVGAFFNPCCNYAVLVDICEGC